MKRIVFFFFFAAFLFLLLSSSAAAVTCTNDSDCSPGEACINDNCVKVRPLEIIYPVVPGATTPTTVNAGLPEYVSYIFRLSIIIIGFVILGVLIYNGLIYLSSVGNPSKMSSAREGISAGFLGAVILLSSYLIFNTINPQLTILDVEKLEPLRPRVFAGAYFCNKKLPEIEGLLTTYINATGTPQVEAVEKLKEIIDPEDGTFCVRATFSGNFENFVVEKGNSTFFVVPREEYATSTPAGITFRYISEVGIVLHEKDNFGGRCQLYPKPVANLIYQVAETKADYVPVISYFDDLDFNKARSFTLFKKLAEKPAPGLEGVILYSCFNYNEAGACPPNPGMAPGNVPEQEYPIRPGGDAEIEARDTAALDTMAANTRSMKVIPKGSFFSLISNEDVDVSTYKFTGDKCEIISGNVVDLTEHPIGRCGNGCILIIGWFLGLFGADCNPCIQSIMVIEGQALTL